MAKAIPRRNLKDRYPDEWEQLLSLARQSVRAIRMEWVEPVEESKEQVAQKWAQIAIETHHIRGYR